MDFEFYYEYDIITACKFDTVSYPFKSITPAGDIIRTSKSKELTFKVSDTKNFDIDTAGLVKAKDYRMAPGKYPLTITVEKPGSTPKQKYTYNIEFNVLDKKPLNFKFGTLQEGSISLIGEELNLYLPPVTSTNKSVSIDIKKSEIDSLESCFKRYSKEKIK